KATRYWRCCTAIARRRNSNAAFAGNRDRWPSGTIAARSTMQCGIISRSAATDTALPSRETARSEAPFPQCGKEALKGRLLLQVVGEEGLDMTPQFLRRGLAIARPVIGEKGVAGVLVDLCRDILAGGLGALFQLAFERDRRVLVFFAEHAE